MGIEPTQSAWKAEILPLNYTRSYEIDYDIIAPILRFVNTFFEKIKKISKNFYKKGIDTEKKTWYTIQVVAKRTMKFNMEGFPSGQRGQTVNLLQLASVVRIHLPPPKRNDNFRQESCRFFCTIIFSLFSLHSSLKNCRFQIRDKRE